MRKEELLQKLRANTKVQYDMPAMDDLHGITYADEAYSEETQGKMTVRFWNPVMKNGVISFVPPEQCPQHKTICVMKIKPFGEELDNFSGLREFGEVR